MSSRLYYRGALVSSTALENMISNLADNDNDFESLTDSYRQYMTVALESLDNRLWWQPETGEIFCEGETTNRPDDFESWWNETTTNWVNSPAK